MFIQRSSINVPPHVKGASFSVGSGARGDEIVVLTSLQESEAPSGTNAPLHCFDNYEVTSAGSFSLQSRGYLGHSLTSMAAGSLDGIVRCSKSLLIGYNSSLGSFTCYDTEGKCTVGYFSKKLRAASGQKITSVCASRDADGPIIFSWNADSTSYVQAFCVRPSNDDGGTGTGGSSNRGVARYANADRHNKISNSALGVNEETWGVSISVPIKLDTTPNVFQESVKGNNSTITSLHYHPTKSSIFVVKSFGGVQLWTCSKLAKHLSGNDDEYDSGRDDDDDDQDHNGYDEENKPGEVDVVDDESVTDSVTTASNAAAAKRGPSITRAGSGRSSSIFSRKKKTLLSPKAILVPPTDVTQGLSASTIVASSFALDPLGRLAAVVWNKCVVAVYDIRLQNLRNDNVGRDGRLSNSETQKAIQVKPISVSARYDIPWTCGHVAFHHAEPVIFLTLSKAPSERGRAFSSDAHMICALSLMDPTLRQLDSFTPHIASSQLTSGVAVPVISSLFCTPQTGTLLVSYQCTSTSSHRNHAAMEYCNLVSYSLSPAWKETFAFKSKPLINRLCLGPEVYIEGDSVMKDDVSSDGTSKVTSSSWPSVIGIRISLDVNNNTIPIPNSLHSNPSANSSVSNISKFGALYATMNFFNIQWWNLTASNPSDSAANNPTSYASSSSSSSNNASVNPSKTPSFTSYCGNMSPMLSVSSRESNWLKLNSEDIRPSEGFFTPSALKLLQTPHKMPPDVKSTTLLSWLALMRGSVWVPSPTSVYSMQKLSCVCFLRCNSTISAPSGSSTAQQQQQQQQQQAPHNQSIAPLFSSFRDAVFVTETNKLMGNSCNNTHILAVSKSGRTLKLISLDEVLSTSSSSQTTMHQATANEPTQSVKSWNLKFAEIISLWSSYSGYTDIYSHSSLLYCVKLDNDATRPGQGSHHCLMSPLRRGEYDLSADASPRFPLLPSEVLIDVLWQPAPKRVSESSITIGKGSATGSSSSPAQIVADQDGMRRLWLRRRRTSAGGDTTHDSDNIHSENSEFEPLVGVMTSLRIIILTSKLEIVNSYTHSSGDLSKSFSYSGRIHNTKERIKSTTNDAATSLMWVGCALLFTSQSGAVSYLLPGPTSFRNKQRFWQPPSHTFTNTYNSHSNNHSNNKELPWEVSVNGSGYGEIIKICSLPQHLTFAGTISILSCLPDRLILAAVVADSWSGVPNLALTSRPFLPIEPLLLGILQQHMTNNQSKMKSISGVAGLVGAGSGGGEEKNATLSQDFLSNVIKCFIAMYMPAKPAPGTSNEGGTVPFSHCTQRFCDALQEGNFFKEAAVISGIPTKASGDWQSPFPRLRWIPCGFKFDSALRIHKFKEACLALLSSRPDYLDQFKDPNGSSGSLPHIHSPTAIQYVEAAHRLVELGQTTWARRLADVGGNDIFITLLIAHIALQSHTDSNKPTSSDLAAFASLVEKRNPGLSDIIQEYLNDENDASFLALSKAYEDVVYQLSLLPVRCVTPNILCGFTRRPLLQSIPDPPASEASIISGSNSRSIVKEKSASISNAPASSKDDYIALIESEQRQHSQKRGGGLGPPTSLGILAMDWIEDWVGGRTKQQVVQRSAGSKSLLDGNKQSGRGAFGNVSGGGGGGGGGSGTSHGMEGNGDATGNDSSLPEGLTQKPATWIEDVGRGKEWDKLSGYWRFSDVITPADEGFVSSSDMPGARLVLVDLSKYDGALELFASTSQSLRLEESTSSIDPGEDHAKVKALYDVVYLHDEASASASASASAASTITDPLPVTGLRAMIGRGGPLDVGFYHIDPDRCKLTVELSILFDTDISALPKESVLLRRVAGSPPLSSHSPSTSPSSSHSLTSQDFIWSISVDMEGALIVSMGHDVSSSSTQGPSSFNRFKTSAGLIKFGSVKDITSAWNHIAVVFDSCHNHHHSSSSQGTTTTIPSSTVAVHVYINGEKHSPDSLILSVPTISEANLALTTLYVGPNLSAGWRYTELRMWADGRTSVDIDGQRDNHLALASKRKRLQFRIKTRKNLFGALNESALQNIGAPATQIIIPASINTATCPSSSSITSTSTSASTTSATSIGAVSGSDTIPNPQGESVSLASGATVGVRKLSMPTPSTSNTLRPPATATATATAKLLNAPESSTTRRSIASSSINQTTKDDGNSTEIRQAPTTTTATTATTVTTTTAAAVVNTTPDSSISLPPTHPTPVTTSIPPKSTQIAPPAAKTIGLAPPPPSSGSGGMSAAARARLAKKG